MPKITWFRQQKILTIKFKFSSIRTSKIFTHKSTNVERNLTIWIEWMMGTEKCNKFILSMKEAEELGLKSLLKTGY